MTDLLSPQQIQQIRDVFQDLNETFAFPIVIRRTTYSHGAFRSEPSVEEFPFSAIREFESNNESDHFRNKHGVTSAHERELYVHWDAFEEAGLTDSENKVLLDHNDIVFMEGEEFELLSFNGIADMSKKPAFVYLLIKRKWANAEEQEE